MKQTTHRFGLLGKNISYSFSREYFRKKFADLGLEGYLYENFDLQHIGQFPEVLRSNKNIKGLNVTIPYKQEIIPFLDSVDAEARKIGAVNTIQIVDGSLIGHNTDSYGFRKSIEPLLMPHHTKALVLGTGGASKAIAFVLDQLNLEVRFMSRSPEGDQISYTELNASTMAAHQVIVNCTPLGTHPEIDLKPKLPYQDITNRHLLFDLIYNPKKTAFLEAGERQGAQIKNGLQMLQLQADRAWDIWQGKK